MGPTRPRPPARWASVRLLAAYGLGVVLIAVPVKVLGAGGGVDLSSRSLVAAVAAGGGTGAGTGFVLDRDGQVIRVGADGSLEPTAALDHYSTPFGTSVAGRAVFGGVRCDGGGDGCRRRVAELAVLDRSGRVAAEVVVARSSGWPSLLNGLAPVGTDGDTVWVNGGGRLRQIAVARSTGEARVVADVPWPGGEPCVIGGRLHDLAATGGLTGRQGAWVGRATTPPFRLVLRRWTGDRWQRVASGTTTMPDGQNAYCTPGGYEIRDATTTLARWTPTTPWRPPPSISTSVPLLMAPAPAPATVGGVAPAAVLADGGEGGAGMFRCVTTYRTGVGSTRCGREPQFATTPGAWGGSAASPAGTPWAVDHYNMCSAACGPGVRAHTRDVVAWLVERHRPAVLSLNEACYDDAVHLVGRLTTLTVGAGYSALDTAVGCPGAVKRFGNLVLVDAGLEPRAARWHQFRTQATQDGEPCDHRRHECRGMVCVDGGPVGEARVFCSAHLESPRRDPEVAEAQTREYVASVDARFAGAGSRVLAGDFNLDRSATDDVLRPAGYRAAPAGATVGTRPAGAEEIDRIYDQGPPSDADVDPVVSSYCDVQASDHCYLTTAPLPSAALA